uniref:PHP domain-containing protein n=1 Tax=uncultured bacterium Contig99 TaxID=1393639 RepID=W0FI72_9BACT|nr:hypothetical protein [uncultured bacterium Contig99]
MPFPIDHDLHCHSFLSLCSRDPGQHAAAILAHAKRCGYTVQCVTDHLWDSAVPGAMPWYALQNVEYVRRCLPLPQDDQVRMVFGCETEFCGGKKLGLAPEHYDLFDFIVIPPNHFHMVGFVRPKEYDTEEKIADLLVERLEEISELDLPWEKVGIAHMTCHLTFREGEIYRVFRLVDERRYRAVMRRFAKLDAGIELNAAEFTPGWRAHEDDALRLYRLAKEEGCRFYCGSDAHHPEALDSVPQRLPDVVGLLGLTEEHLYRIP